MKIKPANKMKNKKQKILNQPKIEPKKDKVLVVAIEIKFARMLSGNDKKARDLALKNVSIWLSKRFRTGQEFKEEDFLRVWRGLFYAVWMADKPCVQEDLCETIAGILDMFPVDQIKHALMMVKAGFKTIATEWFGIDFHRMDKFMMLVRRYLRGSLRFLRRCEWSEESCQLYSKMLTENEGILSLKTPHYARNATSMIMHFIYCYLEELCKVSDGGLPEAVVPELLRPFCSYLCSGESDSIISWCRKLLNDLLRQSEPGLTSRQKFEAWKEMGCPSGGPAALIPESDVEEDDSEDFTLRLETDDEDDDPMENGKPLDPRAGRVDVVLTPIPVPAEMADLLRELLKSAGSNAYKRLKIFMERFEQIAKDKYPFEEADAVAARAARQRPRVKQAVVKLVRIEDEIAQQLGVKGVRPGLRKRLISKSRTDVDIADQIPSSTSTTSDWAVESAEPINNKKNPPLNKENVQLEKTALKSKRKSEMKQESNQNKKRNINKSFEEGPSIEPSVSLKSKAKEKKLKVANGIKDKKIVAKEKNKVKVTEIGHDKLQTKLNYNDVDTDGTKTFSVEKIEPNNGKRVTELPKNKGIVNEPIKKTPVVVLHKLENLKMMAYIENSEKTESYCSTKRVKFVLKNNEMQEQKDYYESLKQSPKMPFDSNKKPSKTNLKPSTPSPINPFFKRKLRSN